MLKVLRFVGLLNAAVWLGGAIFFSFVAVQAVFSAELGRVFHKYHIGLVAQTLQNWYFGFHLVCGAIALVVTVVHWFLRPREVQRVALGVLAGLLVVSLLGNFVLLPGMRSLFHAKYTAPTQQQRDRAASRFAVWHGISQGINLIVLGGLGFYFWRMTVPPEDARRSRMNPFVKAGAHSERVW